MTQYCIIVTASITFQIVKSLNPASPGYPLALCLLCSIFPLLALFPARLVVY